MANGNFTCEQGYNYGEICTLTCQKGFLAIPPWTITCDINWSPAGHCQGERCWLKVSGVAMVTDWGEGVENLKIPPDLRGGGKMSD